MPHTSWRGKCHTRQGGAYATRINERHMPRGCHLDMKNQFLLLGASSSAEGDRVPSKTTEVGSSGSTLPTCCQVQRSGHPGAVYLYLAYLLPGAGR